jgi:hypothetical protein
MSDIIDIVALPLNACPYFTVNNAAVGGYVGVNNGVATTNLENAYAKNIFSKGDSFTVLSAGLIIPESFTLWKDPALNFSSLPKTNLSPFGLVSSSLYNFPNFQSSLQFLPMENYECAMDVFFDCSSAVPIVGVQTLLTENFNLVCNVATVNLFISMAGVPAALNGKVYQVVPFYKILHTLPLA